MSLKRFGLLEIQNPVGAHNHDITMMTCGKSVEPNVTGVIGVLGIAGLVM
jgi:hypothetical protein